MVRSKAETMRAFLVNMQIERNAGPAKRGSEFQTVLAQVCQMKQGGVSALT
jgi:hypothetical protein